MGWKLNKKGTGVVRDGERSGGLPRPFFSDGKLPPMRDGDNRPLRWNGSDWEIDTARWIEEVNEGKWKPK
jgi:hypothetical protein